MMIKKLNVDLNHSNLYIQVLARRTLLSHIRYEPIVAITQLYEFKDQSNLKSIIRQLINQNKTTLEYVTKNYNDVLNKIMPS